MTDQAEEIRRRLEARGAKPAIDPLIEDNAPLPPAFQPTPVAPPIERNPVENIARQRKLEATIADPSKAQPVVVVDVKIKFWSLVTLMVKVAFAAIPAIIIIYTIILGAGLMLSGILRAISGGGSA